MEKDPVGWVNPSVQDARAMNVALVSIVEESIRARLAVNTYSVHEAPHQLSASQQRYSLTGEVSTFCKFLNNTAG